MTPTPYPTLLTKLQHFLNVDADALFSLNLEGQVEYANPKAAAMAGITPEEGIGLSLEKDLSYALTYHWYIESKRALKLGSPVEYTVFNSALGGWACVRIVPTPEGLVVRIRDCSSAKRIEAFGDVATSLIVAQTTDDVLKILLEKAVAFTEALTGSFHSLEDGELELRANLGYTPELIERFSQIPLSKEIPPCIAIQERRAIFVSDDELDLLYPACITVKATKSRSLAALPLITKGKTWGVLTLTFEESRRCPRPEQQFLLSLVEQCMQALIRAQVEADLKEHQRRLDFILETAGIGYWQRKAHDESSFFHSSQFDVIFGHPEGDVTWTYQAYMEHVIPEDRDFVNANFAKILTDYRPWNSEFRIRRPDGEVRWIWGVGHSYKELGSSEMYLTGLVQDITERKRNEELLHTQSETLATIHRIGQTLSQELNVDKLLQAVVDASVELTGAQYGAFFSSGTEKDLETHTLYALSGAHLEEFTSYPFPRSTAIFQPTYEQGHVIRSDDITQDERYGHNLPYHGMPPRHFPIRSYLAVPVISRDGKVLGGILLGHAEAGIFTEQDEQIVSGLAQQTAITLDNARLYQHLQQTNMDLELHVKERTHLLEEQTTKLHRSNSELEQFAYTASHDLQAPIRTMTSFAGLITRKYAGSLDEQARQHLKQIMDSGEYMKRLVDDLLVFSQIHKQNEFQPVNSHEILIEVIKKFKGLAAQLNAVITHDELPVVLAEERQLRQLFQHLIDNALKYHRKGVHPIVHVSAQREGIMWLFKITDNGIGIEPEYFDRIFEIFQRLHTQNAYEGTGIGLAICKKIVEHCGGSIWLKSQPGVGTTIFFTLRAI